jgi:hypothetical protein
MLGLTVDPGDLRLIAMGWVSLTYFIDRKNQAPVIGLTPLAVFAIFRAAGLANSIAALTGQPFQAA